MAWVRRHLWVQLPEGCGNIPSRQRGRERVRSQCRRCISEALVVEHVQLSSFSLGVERVAEKGGIGWLTVRRRVAELEVPVEKRVPVARQKQTNSFFDD